MPSHINRKGGRSRNLNRGIRENKHAFPGLGGQLRNLLRENYPMCSVHALPLFFHFGKESNKLFSNSPRSWGLVCLLQLLSQQEESVLFIYFTIFITNPKSAPSCCKTSSSPQESFASERGGRASQAEMTDRPTT